MSFSISDLKVLENRRVNQKEVEELIGWFYDELMWYKNEYKTIQGSDGIRRLYYYSKLKFLSKFRTINTNLLKDYDMYSLRDITFLETITKLAMIRALTMVKFNVVEKDVYSMLVWLCNNENILPYFSREFQIERNKRQ